jgi:RNA polymerase sigma-70 factor (ECF subfamily)
MSEPVQVELLMQRITNRDQQALAQLYALYGRAVFNLALYILRNRQAAEELTQDIFFEVWRAPDKWNTSKGSFSRWLLANTRLAAINRLRREQQLPDIEPLQLERISHLLPDRSPVDELNWDDNLLLRELLKQMPKEQTHVLFLAYFRGMSHTQIADMLKVPEGTVKSRLRLGLQKLRDLWYEASRRQETDSPEI